MRTIIKRAIRNEKGSVLPLVLILLVVGGLILTPLLGLMSTGLMAGQVYEKKAHEYYAADAGVEDAIWRIKSESIAPESWTPCDDRPGWDVYEYLQPLSVGNKSVELVVYRKDWDPTCGENLTYQILSTAATDDGGGTAAIVSSTTIDAYLSVSYMNFSNLLDNAIVSYDTITIRGTKTVVDGDVWLPSSDEEHLDNKGNITGEVKNMTTQEIIWPTSEDLSGYYLDRLEDPDDPGEFLDIANTNATGPAYRDGDLAIDNTGADNATLLLEGTVYVTGSLTFQQAGGKTYTIDLNGNTIFVEGTIDFPSNHVTVSGSGCIIAIGRVNFQPGIAEGEEEHFVLVMSVEDIVEFHPSGDFTGCVAGESHVELQPGCTLSWVSPDDKGLDVPWGPDNMDELPPITGLRIESWEINPQ